MSTPGEHRGGHYARTEVLTLHVDESARTAVSGVSGISPEGC
ncbi:hypothetical protein [Streptomyces sp. V3I7]|nr:hypothetical protein [Streptomyces sp. V3I7]MDQ0988889.1 hypothetical protein [Streptomyces sp. V3I7]